jgi:hypothetical protein
VVGVEIAADSSAMSSIASEEMDSGSEGGSWEESVGEVSWIWALWIACDDRARGGEENGPWTSIGLILWVENAE